MCLTLASCFQGQRDGVRPESRADSSEFQPRIPPVLKGCELEQPKALESSDEQLPHQSAGTEPPRLIFLLLICSLKAPVPLAASVGLTRKPEALKQNPPGSGESSKLCILLSPPQPWCPPSSCPPTSPSRAQGSPL